MVERKQFSTEFIDRLIAGDIHAYGELVEKTSGSIYGLGLRMLGNPQDAEDMLQETYLKAHKALPDFEKRSSINTWLFRIATNEALMMLRKRKSETMIETATAEDGEQNDDLEIVDFCCLPENEFLSDETRAALNQAAETLSPALRMVFLLRDVQGFSTLETAEILKINEDAVKTRLVRARLKLREELSGYFRERLERRTENG